MRGKDEVRNTWWLEWRITPAYAGKRVAIFLSLGLPWDHPRLCGEKQRINAHRGTYTGITPAYAGKRVKAKNLLGFHRDHPRLCGEKYINYFFPVKFLGSPPPMRGKVTQSYANLDRRRITPAYAGKSERKMKNESYTEDHPRLCGEKCLCAYI